jgi:transposase-like protein
MIATGHSSWAGAMQGALPLQSVERDFGGPIELRVAGELHTVGTTGELGRLVRSLVGRADEARGTLVEHRAMAGWAFCQLKALPGPLTTSSAIARQFGMNANTVRSWMRLAREMVHAPSGTIDWDLVQEKIAAHDRERSAKAVTSRQKLAAERAAGRPIGERSQHEIERALGTRTENERAVTTVTADQEADRTAGQQARTSGAHDTLVFGEQMSFDELFDVAVDVHLALADLEHERFARLLRDGKVLITREAADELGLVLDLGLDLATDESQRADGDGPRGHSVGGGRRPAN